MLKPLPSVKKRIERVERASKDKVDKVDFKLEFHASRVPQRGWEKAFISIISLENGKVVAKCTKVTLKGTTCNWAEVIHESTRLPSSHGDKALYKISISSGISRVGMLGELTINLFDHCGTNTPLTLSNPLQNCTSGSILHIKIQCLTPKALLRDFVEHKEASLNAEVDSDVGKSKEANGPQIRTAKRLSSLTSSRKIELDSPEIPSTPARLDSGYSSRNLLGGEPLSPSSSSTSSFSGKHDFGTASIDLSGLASNPDLNSSASSLSPVSHGNPKKSGLAGSRHPQQTSTRYLDSLPTFSATHNGRVDSLRMDTEAWEGQVKNLGMEVEKLRKQVSDITAELSAVMAERNQFKIETEQLKTAMQERESGHERVVKDVKQIAKELREKLAYENSVNVDLNLQLRKTQEKLAHENSMNVDLKLQLQKTLESNSELLLEMQVAEADRERFKTETEQLKTVMVERESAYEKAVEDAQQIAKELQEKLAYEKSANAKLSLQFQKTQESNSELLSEIQGLKTERDQFKAEMEKMKTAMQERESGYQRIAKELQDELGNERSANTKLSLQLQKNQESNSELLLQIQVLEDSLCEKNKELEEDKRLANTVEKLNKQVEELTEEKISLIGQLKEANDRDGAKDLIIAQLQSTTDLLSSSGDVQKAMESQLRQADDEIALLRQEVKTVKEEIQVNELEKSLLASQKETDETYSSNRLTELESQLRQAEGVIASLTQEVKTMKEEIQEYEREKSLLASQKEQLKSLHAKTAILEEDYENASRRVKDLEAANGSLQEEMSMAISALEQKFEASEVLVHERDIEIDSLKEELATCRATIKATEDQMLKMELENQVQDISYEKNLSLSSCKGDLSSPVSQSSVMPEDLEKTINGLQVENGKLSKKLEGAMKENVLLRKEVDALLKEMKVLKGNVAKVEQNYQSLLAESNELRTSLNLLKIERDHLEDGLQRMNIENSKLSEELKSQNEREESGDGNTGKVKQPEDKTKAARKSADVAENKNESIKLRRLASELRRKVSEQEDEKELMKKRLFALEEELQEKAGSLSSAEKRLKERDDSLRVNVSVIARSLQRGNTKVGPLSPGTVVREAKEIVDLRDKVKLLEDEIKAKANDLEVSKQKFKEKETELTSKIENLSVAIEELKGEHANSAYGKLQKELNRIQSQNASLFQRESELLSQLESQEMLHKEIEKLKEEKRELESDLRKLNESPVGYNVLERMSTLETELAEALEANTMYKFQLKSAFAEQQNVHMAALTSFGNVDSVIHNLTELKRRNLCLEEELREMRERYFNMSIKFAEVEAHREELVMAVKSYRGPRKLPFRSLTTAFR